MSSPVGTDALSVLLMLADGRMPAGGHAHSGGLEEAVSGRAHDEQSLTGYLQGRLATSGAMEAALAVAAWTIGRQTPVGSFLLLAQEAAARVPSPAQRAASSAQGRALCRAAGQIWPGASCEVLDALSRDVPEGLLLPVAGGAIAAALGMNAYQVATWSLYGTVTAPAWAATRLLGMAPYAVCRSIAALNGEICRMAQQASRTGHGRALDFAEDLPAGGAPLSEIGAEAHSIWEVRMFAS
ncbi:MAG TPA: urease accessory UreF family protein [Acidimicrobiales bacterium]|nr:urease accessory UreF family protein [Acidimicrobiales bacterium]